MADPDVRIDHVSTRLEIVDPIGPLSPKDVNDLVALVLRALTSEQERQAMHQDDRAIRDRSYTGGPGGRA